jgi:putative sigma-54 modulation protein
MSYSGGIGMHYDILGKDLDLSDGIRALVDERLGRLEKFIQDYPPDSVMAHVALEQFPITDEMYEVRTVLHLPGDKLYAASKAGSLDYALGEVADELERQIKKLLAEKRNEPNWKRLQRESETIRRNVPVDEDEIAAIEDEVRQRTEAMGGEPGGTAPPDSSREAA